MRTVFLNPAESTFPWLGLIVEQPTGVVYKHQFGGVSCLQGSVEGFYVPLFAADAHDELVHMFTVELRETGQNRPPYRWRVGQRERVVQAVESIDYWSTSGISKKLVVQNPEMIEEAWVPVQTSDGHGVLVWENSD